MNTLHLTLKKKWFDMILQNIKKEEYREIKPYWIRRLMKTYHLDLKGNITGEFKKFDTITFSNGYSKESRRIIIESLGIYIGCGYRGWGSPHHHVFIHKLGKILKMENIK